MHYTNLGTMKSNSFNVKPTKSSVSLVAVANGLIHLHLYQNLMSYYHSFSGPNVCLARLQMELCRAANIFAAR